MSDQNEPPTQEEVAALARQFWEEEGRPEGKAEEHWRRADEQLRRSLPVADQPPEEPA